MKKIRIDDLRITYSEALDSWFVAFPGKPNYYITRIGNYTLGLSEEPFLLNALSKLRKTYGDYVSKSLIEIKPLPKVSAPIIRRHGEFDKGRHVELVGKWIIYKDEYLDQPVVITSPNLNIDHSEMVKNSLGNFDPNGQYAKGAFIVDNLTNNKGILVTQEKGINTDNFISNLIDFFKGSSQAVYLKNINNLKIYKVSRKKIPILTSEHITDEDLIWFENLAEDSIDEEITGDEYNNKNKNEPELWRPIKQK